MWSSLTIPSHLGTQACYLYIPSYNPPPGKYLGGHEEHNLEVLNHFVRCHEFSHLLLVQALRQFLWSFRWPPLPPHHLSLFLTLLA